MKVFLGRIMRLLLPSVLGLTGLTLAAGETDGMMVFPGNVNSLSMLSAGEAYLNLDIVGWGPGWAWLGLGGKVEADGATCVMTSSGKVQKTGATLNLSTTIAKTGARQITVSYHITTDKDTALTYVVAALSVNERAFNGGKITAISADGSSKDIDFPLARKGIGDQVKSVTYADAQGQQTRISFEPAAGIPSDGAARIVVAPAELKAAAPQDLKLTIDFPADVTFFPHMNQVPNDPGFENWYTFKPTQDYDTPSEISLADWLEKPAGKHGRITRQKDKLIYNGKPIKLWGLNLCYQNCAPDKAVADQRAKLYAQMGVNAVRLHKYADGPGWAGIQAGDSFVEFDPAALDRMDYQVAQFKQAGIYVELSSTFGVALGEKEKAAVPYMSEFGKLNGRNARIRTGHGAVFLGKEIQDLQIRQVVNLLQHKNPYTGLTYAEDPAVSVIELFNEDSALFFGTQGQLQKIPTLRRRAAEAFFAWLKAKYGTREKLVEAWGDKALKSFGYEHLTDESWEDGRIIPAGNPWYYDPTQLTGSQAFRRQRLLDTMQFLYELQNAFYDRYVKALRDAGYAGEILASNWVAGRAYSHYLNLHSDYRIGLIDRHNYHGGWTSMLNVPGAKILSTGMQQVADRPFMLSEWIHEAPNEWGVEGPAIIGAYGLGLQGWDASFMFQNGDSGAFSDRIGRDRWDVTAPQVLGVFPAVAREVLRGDVKESEITAPRYVDIPSLGQGKLGFDDQITTEHDVKTYDSAKVSALTLAVARCTIEFADSFRETPAFDLTPYTRGPVLTSTTGQLQWREGKGDLAGFLTIDTDGSKAVVGFAKDRKCQLGPVTITPQSRFGAIYVTAKAADQTVMSGRQLLVVAIARARNTGAKIINDRQVLAAGKAPIVMEPVQARITIQRPGTPTVIVLDHDGRRTDKRLPVANGSFLINGVTDQTCYYLVEYP